MFVWNMLYLLDACQISAEKNKKTQTLRKKGIEFTKAESLFESHLKAIVSYTQLLHFFQLCMGISSISLLAI